MTIKLPPKFKRKIFRTGLSQILAEKLQAMRRTVFLNMHPTRISASSLKIRFAWSDGMQHPILQKRLRYFDRSR
jgi:hypothetical protein